MNNLVHIKTSKFNVSKQTQGTPDMLRFAVINARSLKNKTAVFADHIIEQNIDVCVVTETWLKDKDTASIADICQSGYAFKSFPCPSNRMGGGTAVMFNSSLNVSLSRGGDMQSFEYSEWNFSIAHRSIKLIAVYRPPYSVAHAILPGRFFDEFSNYLEAIVLSPEICEIIVDLDELTNCYDDVLLRVLNNHAPESQAINSLV